MQIQIKNNTIILQADEDNEARLITDLRESLIDNEKCASFTEEIIPNDYFKLHIYLGLKN